MALHNVRVDFRTLVHAHHGKRVEIRLLQAPVLECKFLIERSRRTENCATLQLGCDNPWVYIMAAIYCAHDPMHPNLAVLDLPAPSARAYPTLPFERRDRARRG